MSGFVAPTRAVRARPRFSRLGRDAFDSSAGARRALDAAEADALLDDVEVLDRPVPVPERRLALATRWQAVRERWAQATFYLFDGDAWR